MKNKSSVWVFMVLFALFQTITYAQNKTIKGVITDPSGVPIPGVNVKIKGAAKGASSDFDGHYSIDAKVGDILIFTFTGSKTAERTVGSLDALNITLREEASALNEVVVIGYGTLKKADVTGSVVSINAEVLGSRPVANAMEALQGKAAGVDITSSERPGTVGSVRIRGNRSLTASNTPLYVVDGVPLMSASGIETINPRDIESIDILKDASATAIYGSRGANGVVIVTTKQGKSGKFSLDYVETVTMSDIVDRSPSMSASDFIDFRRQAAYNLNFEPGSKTNYANPKTPTLANDKLIFDSALDGQTSRDNVLKGWASGTWDSSKVTNTDWTDYVTQTGISNERVLSASGGSDKVNAYGSFGYLSNEGTQKGQSYDRYTAKLSANLKPTDWFNFNASFNVSWSAQQYGMSTLGARSSSVPDAIYGSAKSIYNIAVPYYPNGNLVINPGGENSVYTIMNEWDKSQQDSQTMRVLASFAATLDFGKIWAPVKGLSYKMNFGPDFRHWREGVYIDGTSSLKINADGTAGTNYARLQNRRDLSWTLDNMLVYDRTFAKHKVGFTLLQSASSWNTENSAMSANNIPNPKFLWNAFDTVDLTNAANKASIDSGITERQLSSYMVRLNYGYDSRFLLTMSGRWDGASQLAEGHKWDFFPSAALAWRIDKESFLEDTNWINNLKLRFGVGTTGNSSVDPYATKGGITGIYLPFNGISNELAYTTNEPYYTKNLTGMANSELGWEKTTQYNVGLDFGVLDNRISGSLEAYASFTNDLIMQMTIPTLTGFPTTFANVGKTENHGIELTLNFIPVQTAGGFVWESNLNGAWQKDKIVELAYGKNDMVDNAWFIGESLAVRYGYDNAGLWQDTPEDQAEIAKWNANGEKFSPGKVRPKDQNGDYKMTADDRVILGNSNPNWTMGWNNTFSFKGFDLGINLYGRMGYVASLGGEAMTAHANQREIDYWTPDNTGSEYQKPILGQATSGSLDSYSGLLGFKNAGFVKIRNISLGYNFPKELNSTLGLSHLKLYAQAVNPGSIYQAVDWYDFDVNNTYYNRSFVFGLELGF
jgi:TonB-linked SusC/RagA family outer membrane protein